jgi:hypothetical protein
MSVGIEGRNMRIAGRLALHSAPLCAGLGYHGCDVVVREISSCGFEADLTTPIPKGSLVRLRLPGSGVMLARVANSNAGHLSADFLNPVSASRLRMTVGMMAAVA